MTLILCTLMLLAGLLLCEAVAYKYVQGTLTTRWAMSLPVYALCMCAMIYLL